MSNKFSNLAKAVSTILASAIAALTVTNVNATELQSNPENSELNTIKYSGQTVKRLPLPVMKLSVSNANNSKFVASHGSHSSHSSHSSHRSASFVY